MPLVDKHVLYSRLFVLLMDRDLSDVDYELYFSKMEPINYTAHLLDSPDFVQTNIAPVIDCPVHPIINNQLLSRVRDEPDCQINGTPSIIINSRSTGSRRNNHSLVVPLRGYGRMAILRTTHNSISHGTETGNGSSDSTSDLMPCRSIDVQQAKSSLCSLLKSIPSYIEREEIETSSYSFEYILLPTSNTFRRYSLYSSLFQCLLDRQLTRDEYNVHFSSLNTLQFLCLVFKSSECLAKKIFEALPSKTLTRVLNSQQLQVQVPGALDEGVYIVLTIRSNLDVSIAIRIHHTSSIIQPASEVESLPLNDLASFVDSLVASAIKDNSFSNEDLISTVRSITADAEVEPATLIDLQASYQLPELCGLVTVSARCRVALVCASQLVVLSNELAAVEHSFLFIAH